MPSRLYDWDRWFARRRFFLRRGKDYVCSHGSMAQQLRNAFITRRQNGSRLSVRETQDGLHVEVLEDAGTAA